MIRGPRQTIQVVAAASMRSPGRTIHAPRQVLAQYVSICVAQRNDDWVHSVHQERQKRLEKTTLDVDRFASWRFRESQFRAEASRVGRAA